MIKFFGINTQSSSYTTSYKWRSKHLYEDISDTNQTKKKGKKLLDREQITLEMYNELFKILLFKTNVK